MFANKQALFGALLLLLIVMIGTPHAYGCTFIDTGAAMAAAVEKSKEYFYVTTAIATATIGICLYRKRWLVVIAAIALLTFHPWWTVSPSYGPDCEFLNVQVSKLVLAAMCILLGYTVLKMVRARESGD